MAEKKPSEFKKNSEFKTKNIISDTFTPLCLKTSVQLIISTFADYSLCLFIFEVMVTTANTCFI